MVFENKQAEETNCQPLTNIYNLEKSFNIYTTYKIRF